MHAHCKALLCGVQGLSCGVTACVANHLRDSRNKHIIDLLNQSTNAQEASLLTSTSKADTPTRTTSTQRSMQEGPPADMLCACGMPLLPRILVHKSFADLLLEWSLAYIPVCLLTPDNAPPTGSDRPGYFQPPTAIQCQRSHLEPVAIDIDRVCNQHNVLIPGHEVALACNMSRVIPETRTKICQQTTAAHAWNPAIMKGALYGANWLQAYFVP